MVCSGRETVGWLQKYALGGTYLAFAQGVTQWWGRFKSILIINETMDAYCQAGSDHQAQQSTHLAEGLSPL